MGFQNFGWISEIFVKQFPIYLLLSLPFISFPLFDQKRKKMQQWHQTQQHNSEQLIIPNTHQNQIICYLELQGCLSARVFSSPPNPTQLHAPANGPLRIRLFDSEIDHSCRDNAKQYLLLGLFNHQQARILCSNQNAIRQARWLSYVPQAGHSLFFVFFFYNLFSFLF